MLYLDDVEFALASIEISAHFIHLGLFKLLFFDLQYLGLQVDHSFLKLVPLLRQFRYLNLLLLILLPQSAHCVLNALFVMWIPRRTRIVRRERRLVPASRPETEHLCMLISRLVQAKFRFIRLYLSYLHIARSLT